MLSLPATALALLGGVGWRHAFERRDVRAWRFWLQVAAASGLGVTALLIYQPCACFFLLPAAIRLLDKDHPRDALRAGTWTVAGFTGLSAGYFTVFQMIRPHLDKSEDIVIHRADMVSDVAGRLRFYLADVLPRSFESWAAFSGVVPRGLALCTAGLLTLLFLVRLARTKGAAAMRLQAFLVAPLLFGLASSPLLVVKDSYAPFRTLAVLYSLVVVGLAGGVREIQAWIPANRRAVHAVLIACWAGLIVLNGVAAAGITREGLVKRSVRELDVYRRFVKARLAVPPREVIVLLPYPQDMPRFSRIAPQHEFGTASSSVDWSFPGLFYFAFDDECRHDPPAGRPPSNAAVLMHTVPADGPELFQANVPVVDASRVLKGEWSGDVMPRSGPVTQDEFFGEVQQLTPTLRLSRWFGSYEVLSPASILHRELGALDLSGQGGKDCWFHSERLGWFWTSPTSFPFVYSRERRHWLWYVRGSRRPAEFYDFDAPGRPRVLLE